MIAFCYDFLIFHMVRSSTCRHGILGHHYHQIFPIAKKFVSLNFSASSRLRSENRVFCIVGGRQGGTSLSNDNLMNVAWTISTVFYALLLCIACVNAAKPPNLIPSSCTHLEPEPCDYVHSEGPKGYDMRYYYEKCTDHQCIHIKTFSAPPPPDLSGNGTVSNEATFPYVEQSFYDHYSKSRFTGTLKRGNVSLAKFLDPRLFRVDSEGRFVRKSDFWFCSEDVVDYEARVEGSTGLTAGQKEDMFVHCEWLRMESFLGLSNCREVTHKCEECLDSYRYYLCALYFPKCQHSPNSLSARGQAPENDTGGVIYADSNISSLVSAEFTVTKPCRGLCWDVVRKCNYFTNIMCHRYEARDYGDLPNCNWVHNEDSKLIQL